MVTLNRIYTRTGDDGDTRLATGETTPKSSARVEAYGDVDETNACIGLVRLYTSQDVVLDAILARIQNELFDLGADLATPEREDASFPALRITAGQVKRLETDIDHLNGPLSDLTSFVLPAGTPVSACGTPGGRPLACRRRDRLQRRDALPEQAVGFSLCRREARSGRSG